MSVARLRQVVRRQYPPVVPKVRIAQGLGNANKIRPPTIAANATAANTPALPARHLLEAKQESAEPPAAIKARRVRELANARLRQRHLPAVNATAACTLASRSLARELICKTITSMTDQHEVALVVATLADSELLSNLLELYIHDLSDVFPNIEIGTDGRFGYDKLALYWTEPDRRFPFLIKFNGHCVGFVLATRGSPATDDPNVFDIAEFFVIRRHRRSNVGRQAARLLWNRLPGKWIVRVSEGNLGALPFWTRVIAEFIGGTAIESRRPGTPHDWRVFEFESALRQALT